MFLLADFTIFEGLKTYEQTLNGDESYTDIAMEGEEEEEEGEEEEEVIPTSPLRDRPFFNSPPLPLPLSISSEATAVCLSLTSQVSQKIPTSLSSTSSFSTSFSSSYRGLSHAQVTVLPQSITQSHSHSHSHSQSKASGIKTGHSSSSSSSSSKPSPHSSYSLASNMSIELHYATPLSEVVTSQSLAAYNDILRFLLPISTAKWAADSAWIRCMRSDLFSKGREKSQFREEKKKKAVMMSMSMSMGIMDDQEGEIDKMDYVESSLQGREKEKKEEKERHDYLNRARCRAGMSLMIHTLSVLQTHYMGIIHGHILPIYLDAPSHAPSSSSSTSSSASSSSPLPSASIPPTTITTVTSSSSSSRHTPFHSAAFPVASSPMSAPPTSFSTASLPFSRHVEEQRTLEVVDEAPVKGDETHKTH